VRALLRRAAKARRRARILLSRGSLSRLDLVAVKRSYYVTPEGGNFEDVAPFPRAHGHPEPSKRAIWPATSKTWEQVYDEVYDLVDHPRAQIIGLPKKSKHFSWRRWIKDPKLQVSVDQRFTDPVFNERVFEQYSSALSACNDAAWSLCDNVLHRGYSTRSQRDDLRYFAYGINHQGYSSKKSGADCLRSLTHYESRLKRLVFQALRAPTQ